MNYWLHRISHLAEASYPLLERGILTIGFGDFCDREFLDQTEAGDWGQFEKAFSDRWGQNPRTRYNLWRFIVEMKVDDFVIVPSWGVFSVYEIESDALLMSEADADGLQVWHGNTLCIKADGAHIGERHLDLGFFRRVKLVAKDISRYEFADAALTSRMKLRSTNANITDLAANIRKAIEAHRSNRPINLHSQILSVSQSHLLRLIQDELTPDKLEKLIVWYFKQLGASETYITARNAADKQGDADIVAVFEALKTIYYVQAKHHRGTTSEWAAQQIKEYKDDKDRMDDGYSKIAWVVSTAESFSVECVQLAKENSVGLFTGPDLARMILEVGIQNLDSAL